MVHAEMMCDTRCQQDKDKRHYDSTWKYIKTVNLNVCYMTLPDPFDLPRSKTPSGDTCRLSLAKSTNHAHAQYAPVLAHASPFHKIVAMRKVVNIANDQRTLKEIENKILYMLANASGELDVHSSLHPDLLLRSSYRGSGRDFHMYDLILRIVPVSAVDRLARADCLMLPPHAVESSEVPPFTAAHIITCWNSSSPDGKPRSLSIVDTPGLLRIEKCACYYQHLLIVIVNIFA